MPNGRAGVFSSYISIYDLSASISVERRSYQGVNVNLGFGTLHNSRGGIHQSDS